MGDDLFEVFEDLFERRRRRKGRDGEYGNREGYDGRPESEARAKPAAPPVFCMDCGARNEGGQRFCQECGSLLPSPGEEMRCLKCNSVVPLTAKFCGKCGAKVA